MYNTFVAILPQYWDIATFVTFRTTFILFGNIKRELKYGRVLFVWNRIEAVKSIEPSIVLRPFRAITDGFHYDGTSPMAFPYDGTSPMAFPYDGTSPIVGISRPFRAIM